MDRQTDAPAGGDQEHLRSAADTGVPRVGSPDLGWRVDDVEFSACALYLLTLFQEVCVAILMLEGKALISVALASPFKGPQCLQHSFFFLLFYFFFLLLQISY